MTTSAPNLRVRISADINDIKQGLALVRSEVAAFKQEAAKSIDLKGITDGFGQLRNLMGGLFAGVTVGGLFRALITETRDASNEVAQLQAVLASTGEQAGFTQQQLLDMAEKMAGATTLSAGEIVKAQTRLLSYTGIVGEQFPKAVQMAIDQSARLGENVEQSAETIGKALDKPSQGVAALTKQGFKFTEQQKQQMKVMEATGRTAEAQQIVLDALGESYGGAAQAARNTFGGALSAVGNSLRELVDGSGSGSLGAVTAAINDVAKALASPDMKAAAGALADSALRSVAAFATFMAQDGVGYLVKIAQAAMVVARNIDLVAVAIGTYLATQAVSAAVSGIASLISGLNALRLALVGTAVAANATKAALATLGGPITLAIAALTTALYYLYQRTEQARLAAEEHTKALNQNRESAKLSRDEAMREASAKRKQALETLNAARAILEERRARLADASSVTSRGGDRGDGAALAAATNVERARADLDRAKSQLDDWGRRLVEMSMEVTEEVLAGSGVAAQATEAGGAALAKSNANMIDAARRALVALDAVYKDNGVSIEQYFSKRVALQQRSIDLEIDQARAELAVATEAAGRRRIEEQIVKLQRDRADVATVAADEQRKAEEALSQSLSAVKGRLLDLDGNTGQAQRVQLEAEYRGLMERLRAEGDATGQALVTSLIDRLVAKAKSDEFREALGKITSQLQGAESVIGAQVSAGMMGYGEGEAQTAAARAKALEDLRALRIASLEAMDGLKQGSPEQVAAVAGLQEIDLKIAQVIQTQRVWAQKTQDLAGSALGDFLADMSTGAKSFKDAFNDMVKSFVAGVARMIAQEAALRAVRGLFNAGGGVGSAASELSAVVSKHHSGGIVGGGGSRMRLAISPAMVGQAPRFHSGGGFALKSDERVAVLQTGERVLSRRQTAAYDAAGSGGRLKVEIHNNGTPARIDSAQMGRGADGEKLLEVFLSAAADDVASGGQIARAGVARYGWADRV